MIFSRRGPEKSSVAVHLLESLEEIGRFSGEEGCLKVFLPDGHLYKGHVERGGEAVGAGEEIWRYTGLPFGPLNLDDYKNPDEYFAGVKIPYTPIPEDVKKYVTLISGGAVEIDAELLKILGYDIDDNLQRLLIVRRRPQNIPQTIKKIGGCGITGKDCIGNGMDIPLLNGDSKSPQYLIQALDRNGILLLTDLEYRPSHLVLATRTNFGVYKQDQLPEFQRELLRHKNRDIVGVSEYPNTMKHALDGIGLDMKHVDIIRTDGQTETFVIVGDADISLDVAEEGTTLKGAGLQGIGPIVMEKTTPQMVVNQKTFEHFPKTVGELSMKCSDGKDHVKKLFKEYDFFDDKFDRSVFDPIKKPCAHMKVHDEQEAKEVAAV